jgi:phosphatidylserine/phosphatidylglycerophosphate/cardiolipin synthase-like enzyme
MSDSSRRLSRLLARLGLDLPPAVRTRIISSLSSEESAKNLARFAATQALREQLSEVERLASSQPGMTGRAIALALSTAEEASALVLPARPDIAWTGPATDAVALRRVDQVLYELVTSAKKEVLLVTYAAYKADRAVDALRDAAVRGVQVTLVIELAQESGGKISFDTLRQLRERVPTARVFYWPLERREAYGNKPGTMHVKAVVADRARALVSSANLTSNALETNMELGVVVGEDAAERLARHFEQLILRGELVEAD